MAAIVRQRRRPMTVDGDPDFDDVFERRYWSSRVYRDGQGPHVKLTLTDAMPRRSATLMDTRVREHARLLDSYRLTDAEADRASAACGAPQRRRCAPSRGRPPALAHAGPRRMEGPGRRHPAQRRG
jgi:hypothetical protein